MRISMGAHKFPPFPALIRDTGLITLRNQRRRASLWYWNRCQRQRPFRSNVFEKGYIVSIVNIPDKWIENS